MNDDIDAREENLKQRFAVLEAREKELAARETALKAAEAEKKQVLLRIPRKLWNEVAILADRDLRSINGEIEFLLLQAVRKEKKQ